MLGAEVAHPQRCMMAASRLRARSASPPAAAITAKHHAVLCERLRERDGPLAQEALALISRCAAATAHWPNTTGCAATSVSQSEGGLARSLLARPGCRLNSPAFPRCLILLHPPHSHYTQQDSHSSWLPFKRSRLHPGPHNNPPNYFNPLPRDFLFGTSEL